ncbi:MAG: hypothetical protein GQ475_01965 [Methylococcaceae bacterium]|nr:hypothetical protein [Methylococcaceae bacterium]
MVPYEFSSFTFGQFFKELYQPMVHGEINIELAKKNLERFDLFNLSDLYPFRALFRRIFRQLNVYPALFFHRRSGIGKVLGGDYEQACETLSKLIANHLKSDTTIDQLEFNTALRNVLEQAVQSVTKDESSFNNEETIIGVFDQIIAPPYEQYCREALPDLRCINVDRDWRDQYISIRSAYKSMLRVNESLDIRPWDEDNSALKKLDPISYFVELRTSIDKIKRQQRYAENVLWVDFEKLVNNPKETANTIFKFLGISNDKWSPNTHFHPKVSSRRTQKWINPKWQSKELDQELKIVARRLGY